MIIAAAYSFKDGKQVIEAQFSTELHEVKQVFASIDPSLYKTKVGREKTKTGRMLYSPRALNAAIEQQFKLRGWTKHKILSAYSTEYYLQDYKPPSAVRGAYREMDFIKNRLGVEVQFGKYAFMVYNVAAKMTIFHKLDFIDAGVEVVPLKEFAREMSTGVAYFEQFAWDLDQPGVSDIDIPVLILGITA